jgi:excisionase family DNA binding protein
MSDSTPSNNNPFVGWTTLEEAAEMIGRDRSTVRYWAEHGKIACYPVGRRVRVVNIQEVKTYSEEVSQRKPGSGRYRKTTRSS